MKYSMENPSKSKRVRGYNNVPVKGLDEVERWRAKKRQTIYLTDLFAHIYTPLEV